MARYVNGILKCFHSRLEALEERTMLANLFSSAAFAESLSPESGVEERSYVETETSPSIKTVARFFADGLGLVLNVGVDYLCGRQAAEWSIDWGDGVTETRLSLGDSQTFAHLYDESAPRNASGVVLLTVIDNEGDGAGNSFEIASRRLEDSPTADEIDRIASFSTDNFYDADKSGVSTSNMCWGAGLANVLYYTGWASSDAVLQDVGGSAVVVESEDDVFDYVAHSFSNQGSSAYYASEWFLTGEYDADGQPGWAQSTIGTGGFYASDGVDFEEAVKYYSYLNAHDAVSVITEAEDLLSKGWGVCVSLGFYDGSTLQLAHTATLWGGSINTRFARDDPHYYCAILISDSDDGHNLGRLAPNARVEYQIDWDETLGRFRVCGYPSECAATIEEFVCIAPKSKVLATSSLSSDVEDAVFENEDLTASLFNEDVPYDLVSETFMEFGVDAFARFDLEDASE